MRSSPFRHAAPTICTDRCFPPTAGAVPSTGCSSRGRRQTGVTLHHMVTKADAGDIVGQKVVPIDKDGYRGYPVQEAL